LLRRRLALLLVVIPEGNLRLRSAYTLEAIADFVMVYGVAASANTGILHCVQDDDSTGMVIGFIPK